MARYLARVAELATGTGSFVVGCGHAGDGNVHLSVFQPDPAKRHAVVHGALEAAVSWGGAVSGEHGIGVAKKPYLAEFEDPVKLGLMRGIKSVFDPDGILNPGKVFD
jgi:glycolate oxidase